MYDIPLLSNPIVLHPLIYVLFHSSYWHQTELGEEKLLENWTLMSTTLKKSLMLNTANCIVLYSNRNYHNYPHIIKFVCS